MIASCGQAPKRLSIARCKHWIFDLDGTLTVAVHDFDAIRETLGLPPKVPVLEAIDKLPDPQGRAIWRRLNAIEWQLASEALPQPGAHQLLAHLASHGRRLGIVTRNGTATAKKTLRVCGLDRYFGMEAVVGRDHCEPKPSPSGIHYLLKRWGAAACSSVMVGDHPLDIQAGREAGVATVHFDHNGEYKEAVAADMHIDALERLIPHGSPVRGDNK